MPVLEKDTIDFVFAGNVGVAQNLGVVLRTAEFIQGNPEQYEYNKKIVFHIVGNGQALESLQQYARDHQINNVVFHGRKPSEEMPKYYAMADAMIVTMLPDPLVSLTLPAKVQSYMAAGKPIIACADGEISNVIKEAKCGFCAKADDEKEFAQIIKTFLSQKDEFAFGNNARSFYKNNFSVEIVMDKLEYVLSINCF
jgi:glycosyltransferase involved in cell wall biosynthesis